MLPTRRSVLAQSLEDLSPLARGDQELRLRVGLLDGTVVDGALLSASAQHVSLRLDGAQARLVPAADISSLHLAVRRPLREFVLVGGLIFTVTGVLVGVVSLGWARPHLPQIAGGLAALGFALIVLLKRRTGLGHWLTSWRTLFDRLLP
jgi:hypothetical protein